jgi:hypothetical protein
MAEAQTVMSVTKYLRQELHFTVPEYTKLSTKDKDDLKRYAVEEMTLLGIAFEPLPVTQ